MLQPVDMNVCHALFIEIASLAVQANTHLEDIGRFADQALAPNMQGQML